MALQPKWDARPHRPPAQPPARRTDTFFKSDNNTLRQILAEGKKSGHSYMQGSTVFPWFMEIVMKFPDFSLTGKVQTHFPCFPWFPDYVGTLQGD